MMSFSRFSTRPVALAGTFGLAAVVVLTGSSAAEATQSAGWSIPAANCAGHWTGTPADGKICVFADSSFVTSAGSGDILDPSSAVAVLSNFANYTYDGGGSLDNSMSSYISGVNAGLTWSANANYQGAQLQEQPLGYRENLVQDGFNDVASSVEIY